MQSAIRTAFRSPTSFAQATSFAYNKNQFILSLTLIYIIILSVTEITIKICFLLIFNIKQNQLRVFIIEFNKKRVSA